MPGETVRGGVSPTLTGDHENRITDYTALVLMVIDGTNSNARISGGKISPAIIARAGTGGGNVPMILMSEERNEGLSESHGCVMREDGARIERAGRFQQYVTGNREIR